jgi:hypothetical protein
LTKFRRFRKPIFAQIEPVKFGRFGRFGQSGAGRPVGPCMHIRLYQ